MEVTTGLRPTVPKSINKEDKSFYDEIEKLIESGKHQQTLQMVEGIIDQRRQDPAFLIIASQVYKAVGHSSQEKSCLESLVAVSPKALHKYLLAECLSVEEDYPAALKLLHDIMDVCSSKDPVAFDALKSMGNIYLKCGDIEAAEEKYNQANTINSADQSLIVNYGVLAIQKGDYDKAKEKFTEAIYTDGDHDVAWVGISLVHRAHSDFDLSRACLLRALDVNPLNRIAIVHYYQWCLEDNVDSNSCYIDHYLNACPNDAEAQKIYASLKS